MTAAVAGMGLTVFVVVGMVRLPWDGWSTQADTFAPITMASSARNTTTSVPVTSARLTIRPTPATATVKSSAVRTHPTIAAAPEVTTAPRVTTSSTPALPDQLRINYDQQLFGGQSWRTSGTTMTMTPGGALVVTTASGVQTWTSGTSGSGYRAIMQADGNLVIYDQRPFGVWSSDTGGHQGAYLLLTNDGTAEILYQGTVVWTTKSQ